MSERRCQFCWGYLKAGDAVCENCGAPVMKQNLPKGVEFVIGVPSKGGTKVQSVLFDQSKWSVEEAKQWLKDHNFKAHVVDVPRSGRFYHFRQESPSKFTRMRTMRNPLHSSERILREVNLCRKEMDLRDVGDIRMTRAVSQALDDLKVFDWKDVYHQPDATRMLQKFAREMPLLFILETPHGVFLVRTEGCDFARYMGKIGEFEGEEEDADL